MPRHRECSHEERYKDGHCVPCTRKRTRERQMMRRAAERLRRAKEAGGLSLADLTGCDLI